MAEIVPDDQSPVFEEEDWTDEQIEEAARRAFGDERYQTMESILAAPVAHLEAKQKLRGIACNQSRGGGVVTDELADVTCRSCLLTRAARKPTG